MGQYYYAVLKRPADGKFIIGSSHHFCEGLKLMENGLINGTFCRIVTSMLKDKMMQLAWVGDYAEEEDLDAFGTDRKTVKAFIDAGNKERYQDDEWIERHFIGDNVSSNWFGQFLVVNHTKKEFLSQKTYLGKVPNPHLPDECLIDPTVALTAIGNGKGGGDYNGSDMEFVGRWATDIIEYQENSQENLDFLAKHGYTEITPLFIEGRRI